MWNRINLIKGHETYSLKEWDKFKKGATILGLDGNGTGENAPEVLATWGDSDEEYREARNTLATHRNVYENLEATEYALEFYTDEDGEFIEGSDYDLAETATWYSYHYRLDDDDDGTGTFDKMEAFRWLSQIKKNYPDAYIAGVDPLDDFCLEVFQDNPAEDVASTIRAYDKWTDCLDEIEELCNLAGLLKEYRLADGDTFEAVINKAAERCGVDIYGGEEE